MLSRGRPTVALTVAVVTYEWPAALDVVLRALSEQRDRSFEVVVADDGSGPGTREVVERWSGRLELRHAWQPDEGFRRARVLDLAALEARGDFVVFIDGDCVPRRSFVAAIRRAALPGWFLAGKRLSLGQAFSDRVVRDGLAAWRWPALRWLLQAPRELGRPGLLLPARDRRRPWRARQPEFAPPYDAYGALFGIWRGDLARVNGFDTRFREWGEEDVEMAARLRNAGLRCGWAGPASTLLHLWHPRRKRAARPTLGLLRETVASGRVEAVEGLRELAAELAAGRAPRPG